MARARLKLEIDPPYREVFKGVLSFSSFADAEQTIKCLDKLCRKYRSSSDKKGVEYCRQVASLGRRRAELIACNKKVRLHRRLQKEEIGCWFKVWLETPTIFEDWLAMRKDTEDFKRLRETESEEQAKTGDPHASRTQNT